MNISSNYQQQQRLQQIHQQHLQHIGQDGSLPQLSSGISLNGNLGSQALYPMQFQQMQPLQSQQSPPKLQQQSQQQKLNDNGLLTSDQHLLASQYWQQQVQLAQTSRQSVAPHTYARSAAIASRSSTNAQSIASTVTELALQTVQQHQKQQQPSQASTPVKGGSSAANSSSSLYPDPQHKKEQIEEERQRRINEDINKQFWTALDLSGQGLLCLTPKVFNYDFLQKLYLSHNKLMNIPSSISNLKHLKILDLSDNLLSDLPPELGLLFNLRCLLLFDNKLKTLPFELGSLFQLEIMGIEGNPLNEHTKELMANDGTRGVIIDLRETAPVTNSPPSREWLVFEDDGAIEKKSSQTKSAEENEGEEDDSNSFSIMSYNILCDRYATPQMYGYTPSWALGWKYRSSILKDEIINYNADIVCMQEVDGFNFENFWVPKLAEKGYKGVFWQKTRARTMRESEAQKVDGCATFYKYGKFKLLERHGVEYNSIALKKDDFKKTADIYNRVMNKDNVALVCAFQHIKSEQLIIAANTHLHWDPAFKDVKLVQVALLLEELERMVDKYSSRTTPEGSKFPKYNDPKLVPLVVCGDFNSSVDSGVYQLFSQGQVTNKHTDMEGRIYGRFTEEGMSHKLALKSAYADIGELAFTNYTPNFVEVIDYIWFSTPTLSVKGLLGQMDPDYYKHFIGFPNAHSPSDHIPLVSQLSFKKVKEAVSKPPPPNFNSGSGNGGGGSYPSRKI